MFDELIQEWQRKNDLLSEQLDRLSRLEERLTVSLTQVEKIVDSCHPKLLDAIVTADQAARWLGFETTKELLRTCDRMGLTKMDHYVHRDGLTGGKTKKLFFLSDINRYIICKRLGVKEVYRKEIEQYNEMVNKITEEQLAA